MRFLNNILAAIIIVLSGDITAQIDEGSISYKVEVIKEASGLPLDQLFPKVKFDRQFNVQFSKSKTRVFDQWTRDVHTTYIHDKESGTVLSLTNSSEGKYFFYNKVVGNQILSIGHNYGDTTIIETNETKEILGYSCKKIELDLGGQGVATFWVAEDVSVGAVVPESPLALEHPALEYTFIVGGTKTHYVATSFETKSQDKSVFDETIPEGFKLIVPISEYDQSGIFSTPELNENDKLSFVKYPVYPSGKEALYDIFEGIPTYQATEEDFMIQENEEPFYFGPSTVSIRLIINKDGTFSNISINLSPNEETTKSVLELLEEMTTWTPAMVRGIAVDSEMSLIVNIPVDKSME